MRIGNVIEIGTICSLHFTLRIVGHNHALKQKTLVGKYHESRVVWAPMATRQISLNSLMSFFQTTGNFFKIENEGLNQDDCSALSHSQNAAIFADFTHGGYRWLDYHRQRVHNLLSILRTAGAQFRLDLHRCASSFRL